jgi:hypothetical protein
MRMEMWALWIVGRQKVARVEVVSLALYVNSVRKDG